SNGNQYLRKDFIQRSARKRRTSNIEHLTSNGRKRFGNAVLNGELDVGRWTLDVCQPCRGAKPLIPSPSNRFSSSECGAGGASNPNFTKSFRRRSVSVNRGKLPIVPKRRASWPAGRCAEKLCTDCGRNIDRKPLGTFPTLHGFHCS